MAITINISDSYVQQYIDSLKSDTFTDINNAQVTFATNYKNIITIVQPKITTSRANLNRLLSYYTDRYNKLTNRINTLVSSTSTNDLTSEYNNFNSFTVANIGVSTDMDTLAGTVNIIMSGDMATLKEWRRELKVITTLMANMQYILDNYDALSSNLDTVNGAL